MRQQSRIQRVSRLPVTFEGLLETILVVPMALFRSTATLFDSSEPLLQDLPLILSR